MTEDLHREDSYRKNSESLPYGHNRSGVATDQTVFYPKGNGQLGNITFD